MTILMTFSEGKNLWSSVDDKAIQKVRELIPTQNVNFRGDGAQVPLHRAALRLFPEAILLLLDYGADASAVDDRGRTPMHYVKPGEEESLDCLYLLSVAGADVRTKDDGRMTALHANIQARDLSNEEHMEDVIFLLELGADCRARDRHGMTPLGLTSKHGLCAVALQLIRFGADTNPCDEFGNTPIFVTSNTAYLKLLLRYGADVNMRNDIGDTPLHCACAHMRPDLSWIRALLDAGADAQARNHVGQTPTDRANFLPDPGVTQLLIEYQHRRTS
jgi:ankyrin repeat protein